MSRRRKPKHQTHHAYVMVQINCHADHHVGRIVRQNGEDLIESPLERVYGPDGETTKVRAPCAACRAAGSKADPQIAWPRLIAMLDELEANPTEHKGTISTT